nr:MAG TPA: hypothetical protein [Caudoviricetes sp.]
MPSVSRFPVLNEETIFQDEDHATDGKERFTEEKHKKSGHS